MKLADDRPNIHKLSSRVDWSAKKIRKKMCGDIKPKKVYLSDGSLQSTATL